MDIITRKEAMEQGLKQYFTGEPCKWGHISTRFTCNKNCVECSYIRMKQYPDARKEPLRKWRENNQDRIKANKHRWHKENREKTRVRVRRRKAMLLSAHGDHTAEDIQWLLEKQNHKCVYCKKSLKKEYHVDHIIALSKGGENGKDNLQILCPFCNLSKHDKDPIEYAQSIGLLL